VTDGPGQLTRHNQELWERQPQTFVDRRVETILALLPRLGPEARLLDVGCLEGTLTRLYAERVGTQRVHGVDMAGLEEARRKGVDAVAFDLNSGAPLPYPDTSFDAVVCIQTLEHVLPTDRLLSEIRRVLKPGGIGIIDVPRLDSFLNVGLLLLGYQPPGIECSRERRYGSINRESVLTGHVAYFTRRALHEMLEAAGFRILAARQVGQRSGWLRLQEAEGRRVGAAVRFAWWIYDLLSLRKEYQVVKVQRPG
jgi:ubiquinone/menaquinone biosynthesis C-methylase UbiE